MDTSELLANAEHAEAFLKLLANKNRLLILCNLLDGERSVSELNAMIPLAQSALSQHLASLRKANIVNTRRDSQTIYYSLTDNNVKLILEPLYQIFCSPNAKTSV
ncbi:ArsR/SmtB family transcription factor [Colwelliaceae bacterium BS250]